jgi:type II secretory pathway predicted ATPase ExeA
MTEPNCELGRPFLSAPNPKRYFAAGAIEDARQRIVRAIARNEGPAMLVGGAGTGKSLLLAVLGEQFSGRMAVVSLAGAQLCTRRALLQVILCELGLAYRGLDEGELRLAILQYLRGAETAPANMVGAVARGSHAHADVGMAPKNRRSKPRRVLLLVDEAESLPVRLLEELRALTNIVTQGMPLVSLVLAGGPILEERFADPQLDMFAQRIAARCYLAPLTREETLHYVSSQVAAAGMQAERLFAAEALEAIHAATGGVPRMINQLGDQLVWMAEETGVMPLDAALVQQAWSDLQQLPAPWNTEGQGAATGDGGTVVEFGELDAMGVATLDESDEDEALAAWHDADDEMPASIPIASARPQFGPVDTKDVEATFETAERLLASFDQFQEMELSSSCPVETATPFGGPQRVPAKAEGDESPTPVAGNPFDEAFEEEEIVLDPYAAFETEILRSAPQVINRLDRAFAGELHRCVQRAAEAKPKAVVASKEPEANIPTSQDLRGHGTQGAVATMAMPVVRTEAAPTRDVLIIEDDEDAVAAVIPGKQFRRMFSRLEAATSREAWG